MTITFNNPSTQVLDFGVVPGTYGNSLFSIVVNIRLDSVSTDAAVYICEGLSSDGNGAERFLIYLNSTGSQNDLFYLRSTSGDVGGWLSTTDILTVGSVSQIAITHNLTNIANDPILYVNGQVKTTTELLTPTGTYRTNGTPSLYIGAISQLTAPATTHNISIYNRILSASEILDMYNSRREFASHNGLVFFPELKGASGGIDDGDTLSTSNLFYDRITGKTGIPKGSPIFSADNRFNV